MYATHYIHTYTLLQCTKLFRFQLNLTIIQTNVHVFTLRYLILSNHTKTQLH